MASFTDLINTETPVLVDFYADWCGPCKMMAPILKRLSSEVKGTAKVLKVNVDKNPEAASRYGIKNIPTILIFKNGQVKWRGVGVYQSDQLRNILNGLK